MLAHGLLPKTIRIPAGRFTMGSDTGCADERPPHEVELDAFDLGVHPVTNAEYARFVEATGHRTPGVHALPLIATLDGRQGERAFREMCADYGWSNRQAPEHRRSHPVSLVRCDDAEAYCAWLTEAADVLVRLPTEAEWERAARVDVVGEYPTGSTVDTDQANYLEHPSVKRARGTTPVGSYQATGPGLYDMAGNVWEWVADWYGDDYYGQSPRQSPAGPPTGRFRIVRGGAWVTAKPEQLRSAHRHHVPVDTYSYSIGFRVVVASATGGT